MSFAFRNDDGAIHSEQVAYVDGYLFGDRLLEGVRFKVEVVEVAGESRLVCVGVHTEDEEYISQFSDANIKQWRQDAVDALADVDTDATAPDGTNVHWGEE